MSTPNEHLAFQWAEVNKLTSQLNLMQRWGVLPSDPGYLNLMTARGAAMGKLGLVKPRLTPLILRLVGLSPGDLKLWADAEIGWKVEARSEPGAPPVYHLVSDEVAEKLIKGELTHELEDELMAPDPYIGE